MKRTIVVLLLCLSPATLQAQETILNPSKAQFTASPDHVALVVRYELRHYIVGQSTPVRVDNLGKPIPDGTNTITAVFPTFPQDHTKQYVARVAAIGPSGEGLSEVSANTYLFAEGVQLAMTQKVKLRITTYDAQGNELPPSSAIHVWFVEGASAINILGTFESIPLPGGGYEPMAMYFVPAKVGVFRVNGGYAVGLTDISAWITVVVTTVPQ